MIPNPQPKSRIFRTGIVERYSKLEGSIETILALSSERFQPFHGPVLVVVKRGASLSWFRRDETRTRTSNSESNRNHLS